MYIAEAITILIYVAILIGYPVYIAWVYGVDNLAFSITIMGIEISLGLSWGYYILWAPVILLIIFK